MQSEIKSFSSLEEELLEKMRVRGCTDTTITGYRYLCNSIFYWFRENELSNYTKQAADRLLQEYLDSHGRNEYYRNLQTVIFRLNDITCNTWKEVHSDKGKHFNLSDEYNNICNSYCKWARNKGLTVGTIRSKHYAVSWFLNELASVGCCSLTDLTPQSVTAACLKITNHNLWTEIRGFLKFLFSFETTTLDYSTIVPHYSKPQVLPSVYSIDEIRKIEAAIDTCTVLGKRDYAMILFASRMGMRSGDIIKLKVKDVDSNQKEINIVQEKTGNILHLPIIEDVRKAVDDYLAVRPNKDCEELFLNIQAPYHAVTTSTMRAALNKYMLAAGIFSKQRKHGPHSLRSSMASSMVNSSISYETVRRVLGHSSSNAVKHYARIDIDKLRQYSLTPPIPSGDFKKFLYGEV